MSSSCLMSCSHPFMKKMGSNDIEHPINGNERISYLASLVTPVTATSPTKTVTRLTKERFKIKKQNNIQSSLAVLVHPDLLAQVRRRQCPLVTQRIALLARRCENKGLVVLERQAELFPDVIVVRVVDFVASSAGAVEVFARVDARRRRVTVVLAGEGVAAPAVAVVVFVAGHWTRESSDDAANEEKGGQSFQGEHVIDRCVLVLRSLGGRWVCSGGVVDVYI